MIELTQDQIEQFRQDGLLIVDRLIDPTDADCVAARYEPMFRGEFETGIEPDEWNWREGRDSPDRARQICNGWKGDYTIASLCLRADIGRACALLAGWPGARVQVDNVIWKPPGAKSLGFHQDCSYLEWLTPQEMLSCWIALDDTTAEGGTMELVRGSHKWGKFPMAEQFHAPEDYRKGMREAAAKIGKDPEIVPIVVPKGGGSFHHGWTWHGSGPNSGGRPRRSLVTHCISSEARFVPNRIGQGTGRWYGKYMRHGSDVMDDHFFPILWTRDGGRSRWLDAYVRRGLRRAGGVSSTIVESSFGILWSEVERLMSRWSRIFTLCLSDGTPKRSFGVALIVGTILNLINQGDALFGGADLNLTKIMLTFAVPYGVATYGAVSYRIGAAHAAKEAGGGVDSQGA